MNSQRILANSLLWLKSYMSAWQKVFDYKGKCPRNEYSRFLGVNLLVIMALFCMSAPKVFLCGFWLQNYLTVYLIISLFPVTAMSVRRLNDAGEPLTALLSRKSLNKQSRTLDEKPPLSTKFVTESLPRFTLKTFPSFVWSLARFLLLISCFPIPTPFGLIPVGLGFILLAALAAIALPTFMQLNTASGSVSISFDSCRNVWT